MNSKDVKEAFKAAGIKVRVADQGRSFRICGTYGENISGSEQAATWSQVAKSLSLTDCLGHRGGDFGQSHEFKAYKPGMIVRVP